MNSSQVSALAAFPDGDKKYSIILADPPWRYQRTNVQGGLETQYDTMDYDDIKQLPVEKIAAKDSMLFMWTTSTHLVEAAQLMKHWGFQYKTVYRVWRKVYRSGKPITGIGYWSRVCYEFLLVGTRRGSRFAYIKQRRVPARSQEISSVPSGHSKKPREVYEAIEEFGMEGRKVELFARQIREGWDSWGLEIPRFFYRDAVAPSNPPTVRMTFSNNSAPAASDPMDLDPVPILSAAASATSTPGSPVQSRKRMSSGSPNPSRKRSRTTRSSGPSSPSLSQATMGTNREEMESQRGRRRTRIVGAM
jgi:N6-adenosine-specific RNA methylase IME4